MESKITDKPRIDRSLAVSSARKCVTSTRNHHAEREGSSVSASTSSTGFSLATLCIVGYGRENKGLFMSRHLQSPCSEGFDPMAPVNPNEIMPLPRHRVMHVYNSSDSNRSENEDALPNSDSSEPEIMPEKCQEIPVTGSQRNRNCVRLRYHCTLCPSSTRRKYDLKRHFKDIHKFDGVFR